MPTKEEEEVQENINNDINLTGQMEVDKWRADMIIRITKTDTNDDTDGSDETPKISKPPKALVDVKPESYRPQILTIGPLYEMLSGSSSLSDCKALCVKRFMGRHGISDMEHLMQRLFDDPCNLHTHYSALPNYSEEDLKFMVTVDTIFLHEFLVFLWTEWEPKEYDYFYETLFRNVITYKQVWRDLFLMGNQIPMSYLKKLMEEFENPPKLEMDEVQEALVYAIEEIDPFCTRHSQQETYQIPNLLHCHHLLDCLYVWVLREPLQKKKRQADNTLPETSRMNEADRKKSKLRERLPTASQLTKAGIRFKAIQDGSISVMYYDRRSLRFDLPRLVVYNGTEDVLRNLLAYEQTSRAEADFTKYAVIMDSLIDTPEDVAILTKAEVIENHLGSDEKLLKMWNDMCINVSDGPCEIWDGMIRDILHHYHSDLRAVYVEFREKYFSKPWLTISLIVGFLLLLFSALQTGYTITGYYRKDNPSAAPAPPPNK